MEQASEKPKRRGRWLIPAVAAAGICLLPYPGFLPFAFGGWAISALSRSEDAAQVVPIFPSNKDEAERFPVRIETKYGQQYSYARLLEDLTASGFRCRLDKPSNNEPRTRLNCEKSRVVGPLIHGKWVVTATHSPSGDSASDIHSFHGLTGL